METIFVCLCATLFATAPCLAQDEILSKTIHETLINSKPIEYSATVGAIPTRDGAGKETGKIFYIAYQKLGVEDLDRRPVTFAFNGGPGSSSVCLHLGAFGPKRIQTFEEGQSITAPYKWIDNMDSILDLTDLVFIDPIGTGFSRTDDPDNDSFYEVQSDINSVGDFICDYVTMEGRWKSPKYVAGESYGTLRACGVSKYLLTNYGLYLNGLILISCAIDFQTLEFSLNNEMPYSLFIPSYAATAWYHGRLDEKLSLEETIKKSKAFSIDFATELARNGHVPPNLYSAISEWTALPIDLIDHNDGLIDDSTFFVSFLAREKQVVGRFDSRFIGPIIPPRTKQNYVDPSETNLGGILSAVLHAYLHEELSCSNSWPRYEICPSIPWKFSFTNAMDPLRSTLSMNPSMKIFVACGYFDLATPFAAAEHCFKRLHLPIADCLVFGYYEGGHMFYINPSARHQFKNDLTHFYLRDVQ